jgi:hypothetical protein
MKGYANTNNSYSWVVQIFPVIEEQDLYNTIKSGSSSSVVNYTIPVLKCKSSGVASTGAGISYVINGGVNDLSTGTFGTGAGAVSVTDTKSVKFSAAPTRSRDAAGTYYGVKIDDIKSTTKTMIVSENLQAGNWSFGIVAASASATAAGEEDEDGGGDPGPSGGTINNTLIEQHLAFTYGLNEAVAIKAINVGLDGTASNLTARPSSNHPAIVIAGFADGGARRVNESIGYDVYIKLCMPSSSNIDTADLGW